MDDDTLKALKSESVSVRNPEMDTRQIARHYKSDERVLKSDNPGKRKLERDRQNKFSNRGISPRRGKEE